MAVSRRGRVSAGETTSNADGEGARAALASRQLAQGHASYSSRNAYCRRVPSLHSMSNRAFPAKLIFVGWTFMGVAAWEDPRAPFDLCGGKRYR